jgi:uncharacterized protein YjbI with pentapeptide repeats
LGVVSGHVAYLAAAGAFATIPIAYAVVSLARASAGLRRPAMAFVALGCVGALVPATVVVLRSCNLRLEAGADLSGCDLSGQDLSGLDLSGADLADADLSDTDLRVTDLTDADLSGASLEGASIEGASLDGATLVDADLRDQDLSGIDLTGSDLSGVNLAGATLVDAELAGSDLTAADLIAADLARADLSGAALVNADLAGASLDSVDLEGADLTGADLSGASLDGVVLTEATLSGADLTGASLEDAQMDGVDLTGAVLDDADLGRALLRHAAITDATLVGANLVDAVLDGANVSGTAIEGASLEGASLVDVVGLADLDLAAALGIAIDDLGETLAVQNIRLERREDILAALAPACRGEGIAEAAVFPTGSLRSVVVLSKIGRPASLTEETPARWEPVAVRFAQLVACAGPERSETVEVCRYFVIETGQRGETVRRVRFSLPARIVEARTGNVVDERVFEGSQPQFCALEINPPLFEATLAGDHVTFPQIRPWLERFVG